ncbi:MAG: DegQ family serine endoprotease [Pseudomonadales bacterium]|nr:DegQ family serine endoprotease [Pseudomonadales bacterium]
MFFRISFLLCLLLIAPCSYASAALPDFTVLVEKYSPAVVKINTESEVSRQNPYENLQVPEPFRRFFELPRIQQRPVQALGSGFIVAADGYIVTNNHVIEGADRISVRLNDRREFTAEVVGADQTSDLALLKIDAEGLPVIRFGKSDELKVGEWVLAIGSPFGLDYSVSAGIVSAIGRSLPTERNENYVPFIQTDVAINPGNSGGPLINLKGEVVGINSQIFSPSGGSVGLSFSIPSSLAQSVIKQLKANGHVKRGWLGLTINDVTRDFADALGLDKPEGALVVQVIENAPADKAGIKAGDVILSFDGHKIASSADLPHAVGPTAPGEKVEIELIRKGKKKTLDIKVGELPENPRQRFAYNGDSVDSKGAAGNRLGAAVREFDPRRDSDGRFQAGVVVTAIDPDSPAGETGLQPGDVIVQIGFEPVDSIETYNRLLASVPEGTPQLIRFVRQGQAIFRTFVLE